MRPAVLRTRARLALAVCASILASPLLAQGVPVIDGTNLAKNIEQLQAATERFLGKQLKVLGMIPNDPHILQAVRQQRGVVDLFPRSPATLAFQALARQLLGQVSLQPDGFASFWRQLASDEPQ